MDTFYDYLLLDHINSSYLVLRHISLVVKAKYHTKSPICICYNFLDKFKSSFYLVKLKTYDTCSWVPLIIGLSNPENIAFPICWQKADSH